MPALISMLSQRLTLIISYLLIVVCPFVLFLLAIMLSVHLRFTDSDYPFDIFKLFLGNTEGASKDEEKQNKSTTQYMLDTTMRTQIQIR